MSVLEYKKICEQLMNEMNEQLLEMANGREPDLMAVKNIYIEYKKYVYSIQWHFDQYHQAMAEVDEQELMDDIDADINMTNIIGMEQYKQKMNPVITTDKLKQKISKQSKMKNIKLLEKQEKIQQKRKQKILKINNDPNDKDEKKELFYIYFCNI